MGKTMTDNTDLPPWMALPPEVRKRILARMETLDAEDPTIAAQEPSQEDIERYRTELQELGMYRLINHFKGNTRKAIKYARRHVLDPAAFPSYEVKDWEAAYGRTKERIEQRRNDPAFLQQGTELFKVVREELARYYSSQ